MRILIAATLLSLAGTLSAAENFLEQEELSKLEPHPSIAGARRYITPGADPSEYDKLIIGSVTLYFDEDSKSKDIDADEAKHIADAMKAALVTAATDKAEVVLNPGPRAALVNVAITEINMQNKKRGLLGYTPIGFVVSSAANLSGMRMQLKGAKIEGEFIDSTSGERIVVFSIDEISDWDDKKGLSWEDLRASFESTIATAIAASRK